MTIEIDRREFVRIALCAIGSVALGACNRPLPGRASPDAAVEPETLTPDITTADVLADTGDDVGQADVPREDLVQTEWDLKPELPSLGGAPDTSNGRVVAAFCDTIVPGAHRDPTGAPGALEANVPSLFFDTRLPAAPLVPLLVTLLNTQAQSGYGKRFDLITPVDRVGAVEQALASFGELEFAIQLVKLGYFSSPEAGAHLGYPGPNVGYRTDPTLTYAKPLTKPHPLSVAGNIP